MTVRFRRPPSGLRCKPARTSGKRSPTGSIPMFLARGRFQILAGVDHCPVGTGDVPTKDYGDSEPMYITHLAIDKSPESRARLIEVYNHELVGRRLVNWVATLAFILMCLAACSGYIRADEATKGYYTNRLRMLVAAAVGAGSVLIYQMVT